MQPQRIGITALITLLTTATASFAPNFPVLLTTSPAVAQTPKLGKAKANSLYQRGFQQFNTERFLLAGSLRQEIKKPSADDLKQELDKLQQLLDTQRKNANPTIEADTLNKIGVIYVQLKEYTKALDVHQQALAIYQELGERTREAETLGYIGNAYFKAGKYQRVENLFRQKLESLRKVGDFKGEQLILKVMNRHIDEKWEFRPAYYATAVDRDIQERLIKGDISWQETLEISQLNLFIYREVENRQGEALSLHTMGWAYRNLGHYYQALELYQQALKIARQIGKSFQTYVEAFFLIDIGLVYSDLAQYDLALEYFQQSRQIKNNSIRYVTEHFALEQIGLVYQKRGQYDLALQFFQQALSNLGQGFAHRNILNNIGSVYFALGKYSQALESYQQALKLSPVSGEPGVPGVTLNGIGLVYVELGDYPKAWEAYQKALAIFRKINDIPGERVILSNIAALLKKQNQPEIAIVFYKQAVNISEVIRKNLQKLTVEQQKAYTETVVDTYRSLADLLLSQGRILEAQQVLELLKIQEIRDFTRDTKARGQTSKIPLSPVEKKIIAKHGTLIAFGQKVDECQRTKCSQLSELNAQLEDLNKEYNQTTDSFVAAIRERKGKDDSFFDPRLLKEAHKIVAQPGTILVYPFVLPEKTWLIWMSKGGVVKSIEIPQGQRQLGEKVLQFRHLLNSPTSDIQQLQATSKELYDLLIKPLEKELKTNKIQNLVFALDKVTRYIPMSALYDGKNYVVENYNISTVLSADLTDTKERLSIGVSKNPVLALGLSNSVAGWNPLPNVPAELDTIVQQDSTDEKGIFPGLKFLNEAFTREALRDNVNGHTILHIATHGKFEPNNLYRSFLLLGDGKPFTIDDIRNLPNLGDVHLVVLSACETALADAMQDGVEINSISYYFLNKGAKVVMASLWLVNDESTRLLMENFYNNLAKATAEKPVTKAEALRKAQLALITGNYAGADAERGIAVVAREGVPAGSPAKVKNRLSHPYYWAPFILIGNGL